MIQTIGLEIHAELSTRSKIFCACPNRFGDAPNTCVCPVCLGLPGTLPRLNRQAVEFAVQAGLATHCTIQNRSGFDRKNYMYPDLPKAYQITQFFRPIALNGCLDAEGRRVRIREIHLEEDAGKLIHENGETKIDYNRCGVPLIEIVTQPDMETAAQAEAFARKLLDILRYLGVCDGHMEQGSFRMDLNLSLRERPEDPMGERTEIKNLNSFRSLRQAIAYESARQEAILRSGGKVERETRRFDQTTGTTILMRTKEALEDYRYFPDPDMPDILLTDAEISRIERRMAELPEAKAERWGDSLTPAQKDVLLGEPWLADAYDALLTANADASLSAALLLREGLAISKGLKDPSGLMKAIPAIRFAEVVALLKCGSILRAAAEPLLRAIMEDDAPAETLAKKLGLVAEKGDDPALWVERILSEEPDAVRDYLNGKEKMEKYLMGQIMRKAGKGVDPKAVGRLLHDALEKRRNP